MLLLALDLLLDFIGHILVEIADDPQKPVIADRLQKRSALLVRRQILVDQELELFRHTLEWTECDVVKQVL